MPELFDITLYEQLRQVPDSRSARGKQYPWNSLRFYQGIDFDSQPKRSRPTRGFSIVLYYRSLRAAQSHLCCGSTRRSAAFNRFQPPTSNATLCMCLVI